jgi:hypothetical protein
MSLRQTSAMRREKRLLKWFLFRPSKNLGSVLTVLSESLAVKLSSLLWIRALPL